MKPAVTQRDDQKVVSWRRRVRFCSPVKPHCTEVGPTKVRLVKPRYTAYAMGIRNKMMSSPNDGVINAKLLHWKRSLS